MKSYIGIISLAALSITAEGASRLKIKKADNNTPKNVIFILSDDHRYDYMGFLNSVPWLKTPAMDFMAKNGAYIENVFVTTSLSSPSRASILTSLYSHEHTVVDNQAPTPENLIYFPQYLQKVGYATGFFGKWHMGNTGWNPQPGFDHWESFKGQGTYYNVEMNVNGDVVKCPPEEYVTDLLTNHAIDFIQDKQKKNKPFFVYLSHKAVHDPFEASKDNVNRYKDAPIVYPKSFDTPNLHSIPSKGADGKAADGEKWYGVGRVPDWVKNQRESWHGVDYSYHGRSTFEEECRKYCATITSLDQSMKQLLDYLKETGLEESTLVIYMGDNGFCWGEHGLIDKRTFYEASVRVPMLAYCPKLIQPGTVVRNIIQSVDVAPTIMEACNIQKAPQMRGDSFYKLLQNKPLEKWRDKIFYEYYWEYDYPQTPTTFGVRNERYKYIRYHGLWDTNEFYDLQEDPYETKNLISATEHQITIKRMASDLYDWLEQTNGMSIPLKRTLKFRDGDHRNQGVY